MEEIKEYVDGEIREWRGEEGQKWDGKGEQCLREKKRIENMYNKGIW